MIIYISQNPNKEARIKMREGKLSHNMIEHSPEKFALCVQIQGIYHNIKSWCCFRRWLQIMFSEMFSATSKRNRMLIFVSLFEAAENKYWNTCLFLSSSFFGSIETFLFLRFFFISVHRTNLRHFVNKHFFSFNQR